MKIKYVLIVAVLAVGLSGCDYFKEKTSDDLNMIDTEVLSAGIKAKSLYVFDNNTPEIFKKHHIPTAVHMNPREPDLGLFPGDKNAKLVFYCKNTWCMASHKGARVALENGYKNAVVYPEGIDGWIEAGQPVESTP